MSEREFDDEFDEQEDFFKGEVHHISASKIADQFWCEMQLHLKLQLGMEPTEEMIKGSQIHRSLEEELGPVLELETTTYDDSIAAYILQIYSKLIFLKQLGLTRELPVIGNINDIVCLGVIDQLKIENIGTDAQKLVITDFKTRKSRRAPSYEQKRRNRIQMQVYWYLLNNLKQGNFTKQMFIDYFEMPNELALSEQFLSDLPEEYRSLLKEYTPNELLEEIFSIFRNLPELSLELQAIYLHQHDQQVVFSDRTLFHLESFEVDMKWAINYWKKRRTPNSCPQQWMCNFCPFTDNCSYFLRRYLKDKKDNEKKKE